MMLVLVRAEAVREGLGSCSPTRRTRRVGSPGRLALLHSMNAGGRHRSAVAIELSTGHQVGGTSATTGTDQLSTSRKDGAGSGMRRLAKQGGVDPCLTDPIGLWTLRKAAVHHHGAMDTVPQTMATGGATM